MVRGTGYELGGKKFGSRVIEARVSFEVGVKGLGVSINEWFGVRVGCLHAVR